MTDMKVVIAVSMLVVIAGAFVLREHWGHMFGYWPYALLLLCPLMHLAGNRHGNHGRISAKGRAQQQSSWPA